MPKQLSTRQAAKVLGVEAWRIVRLFEERDLPEPEIRIGRNRLIAREDLPAIARALARRGWLTEAVAIEVA